jgi:two-component system OmpR family response regulator
MAAAPTIIAFARADQPLALVAPGARAYQAARQQFWGKQSAMAAVLVVEDDPQTARYIVARLRGWPRPHPRPTGREALELARSGRFEAITLDRMLPDMDGLALVARLRAEQIATPVLMISSLSDVDDRIAGLRAGGDDYMVKPFAPDEMAMRVEVLLRRGRIFPRKAALPWARWR